MVKTKLKPVSTPYVVAYEALSEYYQRKQKLLTFEEAQKILQSAPQLVLPAGSTLEEVVEKLERWKAIITLTPAGSKERVIIPLEYKFA